MKLTTNTNVSIDGVMQGLGRQEEDRSGGFERGGWAMPHFDSETAALIGEVYQRADAFLFGRWTYEVFEPRRCISSAKALAVRAISQPDSRTGVENPKPGNEGTTTSKASAASPP